ncbi:outer membrane beta-barrel family protein [Flavobacterium sp. 245]|uniref:outer membrane beta-barrel family protein n=1 Tax=Flavobacterium sp. 245 TaxID=2512115 RepID=UPI00105F47DE|nr:outer membrane beta-barrel family protein [Flavobacterium sp. 245]TDO95615.1 outer membrane receptor protein involved in Fe transport [Flavobacterium sp. 245]
MPLKILVLIMLFLFSFLANAQNETPKDSTSTHLNEVVISQNKKTFTNSNGNIKVDVANSIYNSIPNPIDLLAKLPAVQVSSDREKITVVGKGSPLIYIDNQKVTMNDLNALAVADIKTIEIIQNPSAKYEAEGRAIILITRKLSKKEGFKTEISEIASFKKNFNNYLGFNSNFKKNKIEWKANFNYNRLNPWESHSINYQIPNPDIASVYDVSANTKRKQFVFGGRLFYKINEDDYFSFNISSKLQTDVFPINTLTENKNKEEENNVVTYSDNEGKKNFINSFLNYSKKIKSIGAQVFTGLQYSNFNQTSWSQVQNNFNMTEFELAQIRDQKFKVNVFSGRVDLEKKFKNEMKLEAGGLYSSANSKSDIDIYYYKTNTNEISNYNFKEENLAGYSQLSGKIKKVDFSIGIRVENTNVLGKFESELLPLVDKNYTNFFPKAQFTFTIDSTKSVSFNYAKSITRPNYSSLSQGATYINPYFLYSRNVFLNPTIIDEVSTTFQYHDKSVRLSFTKAKDPVYSSFSFDDQNNIMTFKDINFDKSSGFSADFTLPFTYKFWTMTNSLIFILEKVEDKSAAFLATKPYLYYTSNNEFKLPEGYSVVLNFWGLTKQYNGVFETSRRFVVDIAASKIFFKNWNCTLSCNNIFKNVVQSENFTFNNISSNSRYVVDSHEVSIAIKYSFGKIKESQFKEKNIDENESRVR